MNAFSCLRISVKIKCSIGISCLTVLLYQSINGVGQLNWVRLQYFSCLGITFHLDVMFFPLPYFPPVVELNFQVPMISSQKTIQP